MNELKQENLQKIESLKISIIESLNSSIEFVESQKAEYEKKIGYLNSNNPELPAIKEAFQQRVDRINQIESFKKSLELLNFENEGDLFSFEDELRNSLLVLGNTIGSTEVEVIESMLEKEIGKFRTTPNCLLEERIGVVNKDMDLYNVSRASVELGELFNEEEVSVERALELLENELRKKNHIDFELLTVSSKVKENFVLSKNNSEILKTLEEKANNLEKNKKAKKIKALLPKIKETMEENEKSKIVCEMASKIVVSIRKSQDTSYLRPDFGSVIDYVQRLNLTHLKIIDKTAKQLEKFNTAGLEYELDLQLSDRDIFEDWLKKDCVVRYMDLVKQIQTLAREHPEEIDEIYKLRAERDKLSVVNKFTLEQMEQLEKLAREGKKETVELGQKQEEIVNNEETENSQLTEESDVIQE